MVQSIGATGAGFSVLGVHRPEAANAAAPLRDVDPGGRENDGDADDRRVAAQTQGVGGVVNLLA